MQPVEKDIMEKTVLSNVNIVLKIYVIASPETALMDVKLDMEENTVTNVS